MENKPGPVKSTEKGLTRAEAKLDAGPETPGDAPHSSHSGLVQAVLKLALCTGSKTPKKRPCLASHSRLWKSCNVI